ncbi:MAG: efflux RND transporter periplasmic adaptor subunit [Gammaproteobacteria bacterium]
MSLRRCRIVCVVFATAVCAVDVGAQDASAMPPAPVEIAEARYADFAPVLWSPGSVRSREDARVAGEQEGRVISVAEVGEQIERGDALARLDDTMLQLREQDDLANIKRIEAQLDYASKQEQRLGELRSQNSIAASQFDEVRSQRQMLEQDLARARVTLEQTRHQRRMAVVRAPFAGVVAERFIQAGEYLTTGAPVVRLVNTVDLEVSARAPVTLAPRLKAGDPVSVRHENALTEAHIRSVVPVGDDASRQLEVRVALLDTEWSIGTAVQVALPNAAPRQVVAVPRDALILRTNASYVVKVGEDDTIERVPVDTGSSHNGLVEIRGEIEPGDRLVVRGGERLQPGQAVTVRTGGSVDGMAAKGS